MMIGRELVSVGSIARAPRDVPELLGENGRTTTPNPPGQTKRISIVSAGTSTVFPSVIVA
jgi:hypothetical protein